MCTLTATGRCRRYTKFRLCDSLFSNGIASKHLWYSGHLSLNIVGHCRL